VYEASPGRAVAAIDEITVAAALEPGHQAEREHGAGSSGSKILSLKVASLTSHVSNEHHCLSSPPVMKVSIIAASRCGWSSGIKV
jgi:hypothetical protein